MLFFERLRIEAIPYFSICNVVIQSDIHRKCAVALGKYSYQYCSAMYRQYVIETFTEDMGVMREH